MFPEAADGRPVPHDDEMDVSNFVRPLADPTAIGIPGFNAEPDAWYPKDTRAPPTNDLPVMAEESHQLQQFQSRMPDEHHMLSGFSHPFDQTAVVPATSVYNVPATGIPAEAGDLSQGWLVRPSVQHDTQQNLAALETAHDFPAFPAANLPVSLVDPDTTPSVLAPIHKQDAMVAYPPNMGWEQRVVRTALNEPDGWKLPHMERHQSTFKAIRDSADAPAAVRKNLRRQHYGETFARDNGARVHASRQVLPASAGDPGLSTWKLQSRDEVHEIRPGALEARQRISDQSAWVPHGSKPFDFANRMKIETVGGVAGESRRAKFSVGDMMMQHDTARETYPETYMEGVWRNIEQH